jgi:hypothetical protein
LVKWSYEDQDNLIATAYELVAQSKENGRNQVSSNRSIGEGV